MRKGEGNEKNSKKIVSLMLALLMVFSLLPMSSISALAAGSGNSSVAWQAEDTATAAPAPVFYSDWTDLSNQSKTYYAGDSDKVGELRVQMKNNTSAYNKDTLTVVWQVSDDKTTFTDIEGAGGAVSSSLDSTYVPDITPGQTKYYRAIVTNKGLEEGMTPTSITSAIATITYDAGQRPLLQIDKAMLRQADGTLVSDDTLNKVTLWGGNGNLPKKITNIATYTGNVLQLRDTAWDTDAYVFRGWQIGDTFFDGNPSEDTFVKAGPNEAGALKNFITVGDSDWYFKIYQSPYQNRNTYRIDYVGTTTQDNPLKVCHITPVFEKLPEMAYQINLVQTTGGTVEQVRDDGETHTLTAAPTSLYKFVRWEQSTDGGQTWSAIAGDARVQVTLEKDTTYRAIFESPYKISNMEITGYALQSTGDDWYMNLSAALTEELPSTSMDVTLRIYDGETAEEDKLLGESEGTFRMLHADQEVTAEATKRPSSNTGKVLVVLETETGETAQVVYQLKGTLDATPASVDVDTFTTAFLGREPAEVQLSASGDPAVKSVFWSGGSATLGTANNTCAINESTGLVTFNMYTMNRTVSFYASAGDGRIAEAKVNFKACGQASKINEKVVKVPEGESKEYQATNTVAILSVARQKVSVKSSDESIFTAEIITRAGSKYQPQDIVDKYKINGIKAGTATLTITVNGKSAEWRL